MRLWELDGLVGYNYVTTSIASLALNNIDISNFRRSLDLRFSQEIQTIPAPSLGDLRYNQSQTLTETPAVINNTLRSLNDIPADVTDGGVEGQKQCQDANSSPELEHNPDGKFSYHQDSMKRYKKQISRNSELMGRNFKDEEGKGEVGV